LLHQRHHTVKLALLFPVEILSVLPAILAQLLSLHNHLSICGCQDFASVLATHDNHLVMNFPDIITALLGSVTTKLCAM
jgi:hypothetical protein